MEPTLYALSSGPGRAGVAVFRVSGPRASDAVEHITGRTAPAARKAVLRVFYNSVTGDVVDRGLVLWFPAPGSATGFDVAEFHCHGGPAIGAAMLEALASVEGLTLAPPGGFVRQSFHNGKLDLTQVEGLADLIAAETDSQRRQALAQSDGRFSQALGAWQGALLEALAYTEAVLDFPDEADAPIAVPEGLAHAVREVLAAIEAELIRAPAGERLRDGVQVAIVGRPNVGKSTLLNALARRDVAIVSDIPGTTRDVLEVALDVGGVPVRIFDTAGLRATEDPVEREGISRAYRAAAAADLRIWVAEPAEPRFGLETDTVPEPGDILVLNKCDLRAGDCSHLHADTVRLSARFGTGMDLLLAKLGRRVGELSGNSAPGLVTRARHREALAVCAAAIDRWSHAPALELGAEDLRLAVRALGRISGAVDVEDVLDVIFGSFCIGK